MCDFRILRQEGPRKRVSSEAIKESSQPRIMAADVVNYSGSSYARD